MAWTGQVAEQAPQSKHFPASIVRFPFCSEIASAGQSLSHAPQLVQASLTLNAIVFPSLVL